MLGNSELSSICLRTVIIIMRPKYWNRNCRLVHAGICKKMSTATASESPSPFEKKINDIQDLLKESGLSAKDMQIYPGLLTTHPKTIENHGMVLKEGGFEIVTPYIMSRYLKMVKTEISVLKSQGYIASQTDVTGSFLHHVENPPLYGLPEMDNSFRFIDVYNSILMHYLMWRLDTTEEKLHVIMERYKKIKHRSLRFLAQTLDILENDVGLTKEKILRNGFLLYSHPLNTLDTLQRIPMICGVDIRRVIKLHPKIVSVNTDTIIKTLEIVKDYGIPDTAVQRCWYILTLGSDSVKERLEYVQRVPELRVLLNNPRVLRLVVYNKKVRTRLSYLHDNQIQSASLHILSSANKFFDKFIQDGESRSRGVDAINYLSLRLEATEAELRKLLNENPYWQHIPVVKIQSTLKALLADEYSKEEILENIHILLYPSDVVTKELSRISDNEEVKAAQQMRHELHDIPLHLSRLLPNKTKLALCLYFLEREHHFTGNGVWQRP